MKIRSYQAWYFLATNDSRVGGEERGVGVGKAESSQQETFQLFCSKFFEIVTKNYPTFYMVLGKSPPGKSPPGKFTPIKLPPRKFPPGKFSPSKFPPGIFPLIFLILSYYKRLFLHLTLHPQLRGGRVYMCILLPGRKFLISAERLGVFSWKFGNVETACLFQLPPLIHVFLPCSIQDCSTKCLCGKLPKQKLYISTIFDGTVHWGEFTLHQYYKHKTFVEKKLLNFSLCLIVSSITFILYNNQILNNCFHFSR